MQVLIGTHPRELTALIEKLIKVLMFGHQTHNSAHNLDRAFYTNTSSNIPLLGKSRVKYNRITTSVIEIKRTTKI